MEKEFKIDIEIAQEIQRLEEMYKHYKKLYRRVRFLCCTNERAVAKYNKDVYKEKLKGMRANCKLQGSNLSKYFWDT